MMTEIHAKVSQNQVNLTKFTNLLYLHVIFIPWLKSNADAHLNEDNSPTEGPTASKKAATDRTVLADKKKPVAKDKKRTLKRLWASMYINAFLFVSFCFTSSNGLKISVVFLSDKLHNSPSPIPFELFRFRTSMQCALFNEQIYPCLVFTLAEGRRVLIQFPFLSLNFMLIFQSCEVEGNIKKFADNPFNTYFYLD